MLLADPGATEALGARLSDALRVGDVVALSGDLGAGKTTLARGLLAALGLVGETPSPTFAIVQPYAPPEVRLAVWHVDLYRLEGPDDAAELGLDDARSAAAVLIEWPERLGDRLPRDALQLHLASSTNGARRLTWHVPPSWEGRWPPTA